MPRVTGKGKKNILVRGSNPSKDTDTKIQGRKADTKMQGPMSSLM